MDDRRYLNIAGAAGIVFVILVAIGAFIAGTPPDTDAAAAEVREYFADDRTLLLIGSLLSLLAFPFAVVFFVALAATLRKPAGHLFGPAVVLVAAVLIGAMALAAGATSRSLIWLDGFVEQVSDDVVLVMWNVTNSLYVASTIGFAILFGAVSLIVLRWQAFHAVYGWIAAVVALAGLAGVIGSLDAELGFLTMVGFLGFLVGIVAMSIAMIATGQAAAEVSGSPATGSPATGSPGGGATPGQPA